MIKENFTGSKKISLGIWVYDHRTLSEEQKEWDEDVIWKDFNFSSFPYWLMTEDGCFVGIKDLSELNRLHELVRTNNF